MRALVLLTVLVGVFAIPGCATVTKTPAEAMNTAKQSMDMDARQLAEDWNYLWLLDRQGRMSRWVLR